MTQPTYPHIFLLTTTVLLTLGVFECVAWGLYLVAASGVFINLLTLFLEWSKKRLFGPFSIFSILLLVHLSLPLMIESWGLSVYNLSELRHYALSVAVFTLAISLGNLIYSVVQRRVYSSYSPHHHDGNILKRVIWLLLGIGVLARIYLISQNVYFQHSRGADSNMSESIWLTWLIGFERYPFYALILSYVSNMQFESGRATRLFRAIWFFEFAYWFPTGRKEELLATIVIPLIISGWKDQKSVLNFRFVTIIIAIVAIFPITRSVRTGLEILQHSSHDRSLSVNEIIEVLPRAYFAGQAKIEEINRFYDNEVDSNIKRLSLLESVSGCMHLAKEEGYKFGQSYHFLFVFPIPRFLWKSKPKSTHGVEFGQKLGITDESDNSSISISYIGESFWNFGMFGVFVIMMLLSSLWWFYNIASRNQDVSSLLVYVMFLRVFIYQGGEIAAYVAGFFKQLILLYPILVLLKTRNHVRISGNN